MLHNKYFEILKPFLGNYNREIYGRELIGKVKLSQKGIALVLEDLEKKSILKSKKQGTLRYYRLNLEYSEIRDVLAIAEFMRKVEFLSQQRKLASILKEDNRIIGIFGSYAKGTQKEDSDIDIFIIGNNKENYYTKQGKKYDLNISAKFFPKKIWVRLLKEKNSLCNEIINYHILLFGIEDFIGLSWRYYYGLN